MKRWVVILLVVLALVVLVSPGIVGKIAEQNMEESIQWAEEESPGINIQTESFDRGWFTSVGRHRVSLTGGQMGELAALFSDEPGNAALPSLIIDTRMDHGLIPIGSLARDAGSLAPGLASTISTFMLDPGNSETIKMPGTLYSEVSLGGASDSQLVLEAGNFSKDEVSVNWEGADVAIYHDRSSGEMTVKGAIEPWSVDKNDGGARFGVIEIDSSQLRTDYGFNTGPAKLTIAGITITGDPGQVVIGDVGFEVDSDIEDGRVNSTANITVDSVAIPGFGDVAMAIETSVSRLDAVSLGAITVALRHAQATASSEPADWETIFPLIEGDLQALLSSGLELRFDRVDISLPQGEVTTKIVVTVAEKDADENFSWPGVIMATTASVDLRLPAALFDLAAMMNPQAAALPAMGLLEKDGEDYVMEARFAAGLITVNGVPMPIPIPGL